MNQFVYSLKVVVVLTGWALATSLVHGQTAVCDEGVIRLPDRSGTIQICTALAAKVPQLSQQLEAVAKGYASQQQQLAELTRLVRGLNNVGRGLDVVRQGRMLESLSADLSKLQGKDTSATREALETLSARIDELQSKMLAAMGSAASASALSEAMKGALGDAIARLDLGQANRQLSDISERLRAVQSDVSQIKSDTAAVRLALTDLSSQIRALGGQGGMVPNPRTYPEHYHNARVLAQRGEVDLALQSYRAVLSGPVQLADPIIDFTTLLVRRYGREGASKYLDANLKGKMSSSAYAYSQQLLAGKQSNAVWQMMLTDRETVLSLPPLAALYLRKIEGKEKVDRDTFAWKDWVTLFAMIANVQMVIESGDYLSYFADQIRGGTDIEEFEQAKKYFNPSEILTRLLPNHSGEKFQYLRRAVDITSSPIGLDFTYYFEGPNRGIGGSWFDVPMGPEYMNKPFVRGTERFDILIWDAAIDDKKPIEICVTSGRTDNCVDFSTADRSCKVSMNVEGKNCLRKYADQGTYAASARIHLSPREIFGQTCLSRVRYTDQLGRLIDVNARGLIGTFRGPGSERLLDAMKACGYAVQVEREVRSRQYF
jgi:hypothetical protein